MNNKIKPTISKYRIVISTSTAYPYQVDRKGWIFWNKVDTFKTVDQAEDAIRKQIQLELMQPGSLIKEYTEEDYTVDRLKGLDT